MQFFDAKPYFDAEPVRTLMWEALPYPNDEMLDRLLQRYHDDDGMRLIGALDDDENMLGILGLKFDDPGEATLLHLHVHDEQLREEVATALIMKIISAYKLHRLSGRCSEHLLPFYLNLEFTHWVVGEKPIGTTWYGVRWERPANN